MCLPYVWGKQFSPSPDVYLNLPFNFYMCVIVSLFLNHLQLLKVFAGLTLKAAASPLLSLDCTSLFLCYIFMAAAISVICPELPCPYCNLDIWGFLEYIIFKLKLKKALFAIGVYLISSDILGLPWWVSGKELIPPVNAGDMEFDPWLGRSYMLPRQHQLPDYWASFSRTWEPQLWAHMLQLLAFRYPGACAPQRSHHSEKPMHRDWRGAPVLCN